MRRITPTIPQDVRGGPSALIPACVSTQVKEQELMGMPHDSPIGGPVMVYQLGYGSGKGDASSFAPTHAWVDICNFIAAVPGFEGAKAPAGW